jgi:hypothetical protein
MPSSLLLWMLTAFSFAERSMHTTFRFFLKKKFNDLGLGFKLRV